MTPVIISLRTNVPDILDTPFPPAEYAVHGLFALPLEDAGTQNGYAVKRLRLHQADPSILLRYPEVRLDFTRFTQRATLIEASLAAVGTNCSYRTAPGASIPENGDVVFFQQSGCHPVRGTPTGEFDLVVVLARASPVGVWTYLSPKPPAARPSLIGAPGHTVTLDREITYPVLRGKYVDHLPDTRLRRVDLLNYLWQVSSQPSWIWALLISAAALLVLGAVVFPMLPRPSNGRYGAVVIRVFVGTWCFASALGALYVVIAPPFHAPDESIHFLTYAAITGDSHLIPDAAQWSRLSHFERIRFHSNERFRPVDMSRPIDIDWKTHLIPGAELRSGAVVGLWHLVTNRYLRFPSATRQLLALRAVNAVLFSLVLAIVAAIVVYTSDAPYAQLGSFVFFFVPTVPFFAMHVSNYALLLTAYVLVAAAVLILVLDGPRTQVAGVLLGFGLGLALSTSRSSVPMLGLVLCILVAKIVLGTRRENLRQRLVSALVFWLGLWLGIYVTAALAEPAHWSNLAELAGRMAEQFGSNRTVMERLTGPRRLATLLVPVGLAAEIGMTGLRRRLVAPWGQAATRCTALAAAIALSLIAVGSVVMTYPKLQYVQPTTTPLAYTRDVLLVALTSFRVGDPDYLLSTTFWGGFGWLDTIPNLTFLSILPLSSGVALVVLLVYLAKSADGRRLCWVMAVGAGFFVSMALYALSILKVYASETVHGRYVVGLYLSVLAVCWCASILWPPPANDVERRLVRFQVQIPRPVFFLVPCAAIHAYSLWVILTRYF